MVYTPQFASLGALNGSPQPTLFGAGGSQQIAPRPPATDLAGIYQNQLGRAPDAEGLAFWQGHLDSGVHDINAIRGLIGGSPEAQAFQQAQQAQQEPQRPNIFDQSALAFDSAMKMLQSRPKSAPSVSASNVTAGQLSDTSLDPYMNPYTSAVTDQTLQGLDRARLMAMNGTDASAAGAFGGSRHGVMQSETNRGFADTAARTLAGLNVDNYSNAQAAAFQDIQNRLSANQSNASNSLNASVGNANAQQAFDSNNLSAATALGQLSNLGFGQGNTALNAQMNAGNMQQGLMQQIIDAGQAQSQGNVNFTDNALSRYMAAIGGITTPTTTTETNTPGLFDLLALGA